MLLIIIGRTTTNDDDAPKISTLLGRVLKHATHPPTPNDLRDITLWGGLGTHVGHPGFHEFPDLMTDGPSPSTEGEGKFTGVNVHVADFLHDDGDVIADTKADTTLIKDRGDPLCDLLPGLSTVVGLAIKFNDLSPASGQGDAVEVGKAGDPGTDIDIGT